MVVLDCLWQDEHFGIVPLEGMAAGRAVCACNSGGPLESILDDTTVGSRPEPINR